MRKGAEPQREIGASPMWNLFLEFPEVSTYFLIFPDQAG